MRDTLFNCVGVPPIPEEGAFHLLSDDNFALSANGVSLHPVSESTQTALLFEEQSPQWVIAGSRVHIRPI